MRTYTPRRSVQSFITAADVFGRQHEVDAHDRLAKFFDLARVGHSCGLWISQLFAALGHDFVGHVRRGLHQVDVGFLFEPLLDDFHVQQAEEAAAKAEAQGVAGFRFELEAGIVDRQLVRAHRAASSKSWPSDG